MAKTKAELMAEKMAKQRVGQTAFETGKKPIVELEPVTTAELPQGGENPVQEPQGAEQVSVNPSEVGKPVTSPETDGNEASENEAAPEQVEKTAEPIPFEDLLNDIGADAQSEKKTYSLYLTTEVKNELNKRAKKSKLSPSAYLDELLKRAFGLN